MPTGESKTCTKCGAVKPLGEFYVDRRAQIGRMSACKLCVDATNQRSRERYPERVRNRQREWTRKNPEKSAAKSARWREQNRERWLESKRNHREANKEKIAAGWAAYYEANRDELLAKGREWARANPDKKRAARDPEGMLLDAARRRARKRDAFVEDVPFDFILQRDLGVCGICQQQILDTDIHLDHIIPLAAGGRHERINVQLAHAACNPRKFTSVNFTLASSDY